MSTDDSIAITLHTALTHLEKRNTYVRILFIDYSSAFNTIVLSKIVIKVETLGPPVQLGPGLPYLPPPGGEGEMIVDFRKQQREQPPIQIDGTIVEKVESFKYLGRCTIESILSGCITGWYRNYSAHNRKALQWVVRSAQHITGGKLPALQDTYSTRSHRKTIRLVRTTSNHFGRKLQLNDSVLDDPVVTVHQSVGEAKEQFYYERTVFLRCMANSNPPVRYSWHRGRDVLSQGSDKGVEIYEPFFTQSTISFCQFSDLLLIRCLIIVGDEACRRVIGIGSRELEGKVAKCWALEMTSEIYLLEGVLWGETKILKLKNLRPQDYANYSCIASVRNVCGISDRNIVFKLTNKTVSPSIKLLVEDPIVVNPGQTVSLVCITTGGEPKPTLSWVSSSDSLPEKSVVKGGTLTLPAITSDEAGVYSCVATNNVGNPAKKSTTIVVRAMKKGRFWITPDPYHNDDNIQIGREVKISCQVEATPPEELTFGWLKNGRALRSSERMVITQTDPDTSPGTTNLDIIDLKFTDFGTYTCVAALKGGGIPEISIDVNISSTTVPPNLTVPRGKSPLVVREGDTVELECLVSGKPKPIILWSRADKEAPMPDGTLQVESYDGVLRIINVSREMTGSYRCQTSQFNGFNVKPREAVVELIVQYPPTVEPVSLEMRQGLGRPVAMNCRVLRAHPSRVLRYEWRLGNRLLHAGHFDQSDETEYTVKSLNREGWGEYTCDIINEAGAGRCTFLVTEF
ncbi:MAM domain-containing glycosylphosphatidylinositol anchor protein 2-like [Oncorhynchus masou masou]|uniref:MAM domain-containing glycosylphosphatidylinositol anchor protein 2-like n=1 Tax=Oncorhynchus masou masou TaxID=90313 RepID=UPI00318375AB